MVQTVCMTVYNLAGTHCGYTGNNFLCDCFTRALTISLTLTKSLWPLRESKQERKKNHDKSKIPEDSAVETFTQMNHLKTSHFANHPQNTQAAVSCPNFSYQRNGGSRLHVLY